MNNFFKSQDFKRAHALLKNNGFHSTNFSDYHIAQIVGRVTRSTELFTPLLQILQEVKLTPLRVLKIQLLVQRLLQIDSGMQENDQLFQLLRHLRQKSQTLLNQTPTTQKLSDSQENNNSTKDVTDWSELLSCKNGPTLLLVKIVNPLFQLQERLIFSYDMVYRPHNLPEMDLNTCWATVNLLRKFVEISSGMEEIGRYYFKEFASAMICLMKIIDCDIHMLYRRIKNFLSRRTNQLEKLWEIGHFFNMENVQAQRIAEFLLLIEELQSINHHIHLLYSGRYFATSLALNRICMPSLFKYELKIELFYQLKKNHIKKNGRGRCNSGRGRSNEGMELVQQI